MSGKVPDPVEILGLSTQCTPSQISDSAEPLFETILDELCPSDRLQDKSQTLQLFGYTGEPNDVPTLRAFLLSTLQAHRILAQHHSYSILSPDQRMTDTLFRILKILDVSPSKTPNSNLSELVATLNHAKTKLEDLVQSRQVELPRPILSEEDRGTLLKDAHRKSLVENILQALQKEHRTRVGMLLTRLRVTTQSFSRSGHAQADPPTFHKLSQNSLQLQAQWRDPNPITMYQVLTAPHFVIQDAMGRRHSSVKSLSASSHVKDFVMGAVPDRGGRLTASGEIQMPDFKKRENKNSNSTKPSSGSRPRKQRRS